MLIDQMERIKPRLVRILWVIFKSFWRLTQHMSAFFKKILFGETKPRGAWFRYGFLVLILGLFVFHALDSRSSRYYLAGFIVPSMLLINHLAFHFRWPTRITLLLRVVALAWVVFGAILIFTQ